MNVHPPVYPALRISEVGRFEHDICDDICELPSSGDDHSALLALRLLQGLRSRFQSLNIFYCCGII